MCRPHAINQVLEATVETQRFEARIAIAPKFGRIRSGWIILNFVTSDQSDQVEVGTRSVIHGRFELLHTFNVKGTNDVVAGAPTKMQ